MKKYLILLVVIISLFVSGCSDNTDSNTANYSNIVKVTDMQQIKNALSNGPVFLDIGFDSCPACKIMKPTIEEISNEYLGKITVMYLDTRENPQLAAQFDVYSVPDMCIIINENSQGFNYITSAGDVTTDRNVARFIGVTPKTDLIHTIDNALTLRSNSTI